MVHFLKALALALTFFSWTSLGYGWSCPTHSFIAQQAGLIIPESACIPDVVRHDNYNLLVPLHYHNAAPGTVVTPRYIDQYAAAESEYVSKTEPGSKSIKIMKPADSGVLYWKIVDLYKKIKTVKYRYEYDYYLASLAHFIGDLSQPLHNYPYRDELASDGKAYPVEGAWAAVEHAAFDTRFDEVMPLMGRERLSKKIKIASEEDLKQEIAKIANASIQLANTCYKENKRKLRDNEVADQVASSIVLLKAVISDTRRVFDE